MKPKPAKGTKARELERLKTVLRKWLVIEDESIQQAAAILQVTKNPLIRLVMEILGQDSVMHKKVQQAILDSLEKEAFSLQIEELAGVWEMIEKHDEAEKEAVRLAEEARKNCPLVIQQQLLSYLIEDEKKHDRLLNNLEGFKKRLYPYG
jgi:ABC-type sulfate/molybdate transport systems ATPase subunit